MPLRNKRLFSPGLGIFFIALIAALAVRSSVPPTWSLEQHRLDAQTQDSDGPFFLWDGKKIAAETAIPISESQLSVERLVAEHSKQAQQEFADQFVYEMQEGEVGPEKNFYRQSAHPHWGIWSFLPAITAIVLCWLTKEPIASLLAGIVVGAMLIGEFNFLEGILIPSIGTPRAASILVLYLWLLGGLMGMWANTGASEAFAHYMAKHFVRGPRSAKFVAWMLGIVFFQGGTISSVLVGTTVRPLADEEKVSHEELSLIVDATSSPIAILLAFNAWPIYVQAFMGVAGVSYLATKADRIAFFFQSIPLNFYAIFSVLFTLLIAIEKHPLLPAKLKQARQRARETGELNAPGAEPLLDENLGVSRVIDGYVPTALDFVLPLLLLLGIAIGTHFAFGSPNVLCAFGAALLLAACMAWWKGMNLRQIVQSVLGGQKEMILGCVILMLAITIGKLSQDVGGGRYLVSLLGNFEWYWILPATTFLISVVIAFSTGTCWGTFAVTLPLVMPLADAVAINQSLAHPQLFLLLCFAGCMNGGVFGDQCSPISDTTILSSMSTGADLMDHVTTQIPIAMQAALIAIVGWTTIAFFYV